MNQLIQLNDYSSSTTTQTQTKSKRTCSSPNISSATIFQKNQILDWYHSNGKNQTKTAKHFQSIYPELRIKQPLISAWLKNEESIRAKKNYVNSNVKRMRMIQYPRVDQLLADWAHQTIRSHQPLNDQILRDKWKEFARLENIPPQDWLTLSHGWLSSFKSRKSIKTTTTTQPSTSTTSIIKLPTPSSSSSKFTQQQHPPDISIPNHQTNPQVDQTSNLPFSSSSIPSQSTFPDPRPPFDRPIHQLTSHPSNSKPIIPHHPHSNNFPTSSPSPSNLLLPPSLPPPISSLTQPTSSPPTINQAIHSIQLLLNYLPSTTTVTNHETKLTFSLINDLTTYRLYLLKKINLSSSSSDSSSSL